MSSNLKANIADYMTYTSKLQTLRAEIKDLEEEVQVVSEAIQKDMKESELDSIEIPGAGTFVSKDVERSSIVTVAQRDECIRQFFLDPVKFNRGDTPEVLAMRLIDSFQDLKTKVMSRKLQWKPEKK